MKKSLSLLIGLLTALSMVAQVDTQFWFAVPMQSTHSNGASYHLMVFAADKDAKVTVSMPSNSSFTPIQAQIPANGYQDIVLAESYTTAQAELAVPLNMVSKKALLMTSDEPVYCYFHITDLNSEAYTLKGRIALGKDFYVLSQNTLPNGGSGEYAEAYHSVEIIGTQNNTKVTITPSQEVGLSCSATSFTITLNKGETYAFRACSKEGNKHLVGTHITSNKPIGVNSSDDSVYENHSGGADLAGDQLTPTNHWGTEYIAVSNGAWYESLTILAKEDNTTISLDDGTSFTLNTGESKSIGMSDVATRYVKSDKAVGVWQMTGAWKEIGGTNLPSLRCTGSRIAKYQRASGSANTTLHIVTESENTGSFTLNGTPIEASSFTTVNGTGGAYSYAKIGVNTTLAVVACSSGSFHMSAIDEAGGGNSCTYGYFSDYNTSHEYNEYAEFDQGSSYVWANHYEKDGITPRVLTLGGTYRDTFPNTDGCDSVTILHLTMNPKPCPELIARPDTVITAGDSALLWAKGTEYYVWSPTETLVYTEDNKIYAKPSENTTYTVVGYNTGLGDNVVVNGDFEAGNVGFTTDLEYMPGISPTGQYGNYGIKEKVSEFWSSGSSTALAYGGSGKMMVVDGATTANSKVWEQQVTVNPDTYYAFSAQVMSCLASNKHGQYALLQFSINGEQLGTILRSPTELYVWTRYYETWYSGDNTTATLTILNQNSDSKGNDFAIDEIRFEGLGSLCESTRQVKISIFTDCSVFECDTTFIQASICQNDLPYVHPETGVIYNEEAVSRRDIISIPNRFGCDSIIAIDMTIKPQPTGDTTAYFYAHRPFVWHGTSYDTAGNYPYIYPSYRAPLCDSVVTLHLIEKTDCAPIQATVKVSDICADVKTMPVDIGLLSEEIGEVTLRFINAPLNTMPFRDTTIAIDSYTPGETMTVEVEVPRDAMDITRYPRPDVYTAQVTLMDYCGNEKTLDQKAFTVLYPSWITEQHWDDVIAIVNDKHNGGYTFSQVEWLRNGEVIKGENELYLYLPHDLWTDEDHQTQSGYQYQALLTRSDDGKAFLSCPITPRRINNTDMMDGNRPYVDVTPTRVSIAHPAVHIMTNTTGTYQILNMAGTVIQRHDYQPCEHGAMDITMPNISGMYMIVFMPKDADKPLQDKYRVARIIVE